MKKNTFTKMICLTALVAVACSSTFAQGEAPAVDSSQWVAKQTAYLTEPLEGSHQMTVVGRLGGKGQLTLNPNLCTLNEFGDPTICTLLPLAHYFVALKATGLPDPTGAGRRLFEIVSPSSQHPWPLANRLYLVVPQSSTGAYRLVSADRGGPRRVVTLESIRMEDGSSSSFVTKQDDAAGSACRLIEFENARIVPGIVNDTWILIVQGHAPCLNMDVRLVPRVYVTQPDFWGIEVVGCLPVGESCIRGLKPFVEAIPLDGITGKYGVEVIGRQISEQLKVPPK